MIMMCRDVPHLVLLVSLFVSSAVTDDDTPQIVSVIGDDCVLQCTAEYTPSVEYLAVRWYKVREPPSSRLSGLLVRDLPNGTTRHFVGVEREVELLDDESSRDILLTNVTCGDAGVYTCHLAAPVGQQNREGRIRLTLTDCPDSTAEDLMTDAYMVILATVVLIVALVIFRLSYVSLKNTIRDRSKTAKKETFLDAPLKPLEKRDLMLIYTLGPKVSKTPTLKHICV